MTVLQSLEYCNYKLIKYFSINENIDIKCVPSRTHRKPVSISIRLSPFPSRSIISDHEKHLAQESHSRCARNRYHNFQLSWNCAETFVILITSFLSAFPSLLVVSTWLAAVFRCFTPSPHSCVQPIVFSLSRIYTGNVTSRNDTGKTVPRGEQRRV